MTFDDVGSIEGLDSRSEFAEEFEVSVVGRSARVLAAASEISDMTARMCASLPSPQEVDPAEIMANGANTGLTLLHRLGRSDLSEEDIADRQRAIRELFAEAAELVIHYVGPLPTSDGATVRPLHSAPRSE